MASKQDVEKARYWQKTIHEAARSGLSIREFCRQRRLNESRFYWWQRRLTATGQARQNGAPPGGAPASFALVSTAAGVADAGIELVLAGGGRLRIAKGVDEATLRAVLAVMESEGC